MILQVQFAGMGKQLTNFLGPNSPIFSIPLVKPVVLIIGFAFFIKVIKDMLAGEDPTKMVKELIFAVLFGQLLIGQPYLVAIVAGLIFMVSQLQHHVRSSSLSVSGAERHYEEKSLPGFGEKNKAMEASIKALEKKIQKQDKETALATEELREAQVISEQLSVIEGIEGEFLDEINKTLDTSEWTDKQEQTLLTSLDGLANNLETTMGQAQSASQVDAMAKAGIKPMLANIITVSGQLATLEIKRTMNRTNLAAKLAKEAQDLTKITKHASVVAKEMQKRQKQFAGKLGNKTIQQIRIKLTSDKKEIKKLYKEMSAATAESKIALESQMSMLTQRLASTESMLQKANQMKTSITGAMQSLAGTISTIITRVKQLQAVEKSMIQQIKQLGNTQSKLVTETKNLETHIGTLHGTLSIIQNKQLAEEISIRATKAVSVFFTELIKTQQIGLSLHQTGTLPLTDSILKLMVPEEDLNKQITTVLTQLASIEQGLAQLTGAAGELSAADTQAIEILQTTQRIALQEGQARSQLSKQLFTRLQQARTKIQTLINHESRQNEATVQTQKHLLSSLQTLMQNVVKQKTNLDDTFKKQANQFQARMATAQNATTTTQAGQAPPIQPRRAA